MKVIDRYKILDVMKISINKHKILAEGLTIRYFEDSLYISTSYYQHVFLLSDLDIFVYPSYFVLISDEINITFHKAIYSVEQINTHFTKQTIIFKRDDYSKVKKWFLKIFNVIITE